MNFSLVYLVQRFFFRLGDFFHHWYVDGSRHLLHWFVSFFERLDRTFAVRITYRYLFQPLYKDYSVIGRLLGFIFRASRVIVGSVIYLFFAALFLVVFVFWLLALPAAVFYLSNVV